MRANERRLEIIVKPTAQCNLACAYCYFRRNGQGVADPGVMSEHLLSHMTEQIVRANPGVLAITCHGGEPLLAGREFFVLALDLQKRLNKNGQKRITNGFQSNGVLLDETWLDFFISNDLPIGISLDGPQLVHDRHRTDPLGGGSFHRT